MPILKNDVFQAERISMFNREQKALMALKKASGWSSQILHHFI